MPRCSVQSTIQKLLNIKGKRTVDSFHRQLGKIVWDNCGMSRNAAGLESAIAQIAELREEYWQNVSVPGSGDDLNQSLEKAGRVADFFELGELMCVDALRAQRILRRPFPRGISDARRRGASATTKISLMSLPGGIAATANTRT